MILSAGDAGMEDQPFHFSDLVCLRDAMWMVAALAPTRRWGRYGIDPNGSIEKRMPCDGYAPDIDDNLGFTEGFHLEAFRKLIEKIVGRELVDEEWGYFEQRCFKIADIEACGKVLERALSAKMDPEAIQCMGAENAALISTQFHIWMQAHSDPERKAEILKCFQAAKIGTMREIVLKEGINIVPGALSTMIYYMSWSIPIVPCTGSGIGTAQTTLQCLGLDGLMTAIVADGHYKHGKPDPEGFIAALNIIADAHPYPFGEKSVQVSVARGSGENRVIKEEMHKIPDGLVLHTTDNRANGARAGQIAAGTEGISFFTNSELDMSGEYARVIAEIERTKDGVGNPLVFVPTPGHIALRDALIKEFGWAPAAERVVPAGHWVGAGPTKHFVCERAHQGACDGTQIDPKALVREEVDGREFYERWVAYSFEALQRVSAVPDFDVAYISDRVRKSNPEYSLRLKGGDGPFQLVCIPRHPESLDISQI